MDPNQGNVDPQPQHPQPGYQQQPIQPQQPQMPAAPQKTNTLAIFALISAFLISILGIVLGHISLSQIKKTGEGGRGLALAGTILGYVFTFIWAVVLTIVLFVGATFTAFVGAVDAADSADSSAGATDSDTLDGFDDEWDDDSFTGDDWDDDDFSFDWDDVDAPWKGTELEVFCDALMSSENIMDSEANYFAELSAATDDKDAKQIYADVAKGLGDNDEITEDNFDIYEKALEQLEKDMMLCFEL